MKKLIILSCCLLFTACAGNRTLDGETTKNWVKIVSSKMDKSGNTADVCYLFDLSFSPGSVYERLKNNPNTCLEECCWYSENKSVDFYFNDGFVRDLQEYGVSRRYYPDHIQINMTYAPFLNRLSAKASSPEGISKDGVVNLQYEEVYKPEVMNDESLYEVHAQEYPINTAAAKKKKKEEVSYKTVSISGLNRDELLARAEKERDEYYAQAIAERYEGAERKFVEESLAFKGQVSPFEKEDVEKKWFSKKPLTKEEKNKQKTTTQNKIQDGKEQVKQQVKQGQAKLNEQKTVAANNAKDTMYDVQRTVTQEAAIVYVDPVMPEPIDEDTLTQRLAYERREAVKLLKRFYGDEIDGYLRSLDQAEKQKGRVLFTNNKIWQAQKTGTTVYKVNCDVKGKIVSIDSNGEEQTKDYPIACGVYIVNLDEKTVEAKDSLAKKIARKKY